MNTKRIQEIRHRIQSALEPESLEILDESHLHVGHEGAKDGRGHFRIKISSSKFNGLRMLQQHRLIYDALGDLMQTDIHALSIDIS